jgi:hypothetical protein
VSGKFPTFFPGNFPGKNENYFPGEFPGKKFIVDLNLIAFSTLE